METSIQTLLEVETLKNALRRRMGRELTRQERYYLAIASAYNEDGRALPEVAVARIYTDF